MKFIFILTVVFLGGILASILLTFILKSTVEFLVSIRARLSRHAILVTVCTFASFLFSANRQRSWKAIATVVFSGACLLIGASPSSASAPIAMTGREHMMADIVQVSELYRENASHWEVGPSPDAWMHLEEIKQKYNVGKGLLSGERKLFGEAFWFETIKDFCQYIKQGEQSYSTEVKDLVFSHIDYIGAIPRSEYIKFFLTIKNDWEQVVSKDTSIDHTVISKLFHEFENALSGPNQP